MAIQELSITEVSEVSGGASALTGVLSLVGKLVSTPLVSGLLNVVSKLTSGLLGALKL